MKKLLFIEDDLDTIDIVRIAFDQFSDFKLVNSKTILSVEEIVAINPNVIMLDYLLSDGYGSELCTQIKQSPLTNHIPVIIISASIHLEKIIEECKADAFIPKPFDLEELLDKTNKLAI